MEHIKNALNKRVRQSGLILQITNALILEEFHKLIKEQFNENVYRKVKPLYLKDGTIRVACLSSVISQEISFQKQQLITAINKKIGQSVVKDIKFIIEF